MDAFPVCTHCGFTWDEYRALGPVDRNQPGWRRMLRNPRAYAKGTISHADHNTIWLPFWHQVVMNTETRSKAMRHMAFLD